MIYIFYIFIPVKVSYPTCFCSAPSSNSAALRNLKASDIIEHTAFSLSFEINNDTFLRYIVTSIPQTNQKDLPSAQASMVLSLFHSSRFLQRV